MNSFDYSLIQCNEVLRSGGLILYPTDTIWGIGCDATNEKAVEKIYRLKRRPGEKSMIILVADEKDILKYVEEPDQGIFEYLEQAAKPTTVIYHKAKGLAKNLSGHDRTIAIRVCKDAFCNQLIKKFGKPIVSTSANISGASSPQNFKQVSDVIKNAVDFTATYRQEEEKTAPPSSVVKWEGGKISVIRP
ncbi:MAG: threonylcarbamoyl-AMP synthase [Sphingobacteriales bacterium UTBCD1]|jgi:L-threonylcarbamoyladenylate synthase|nr:MAG: threonylcarbamoyl-AMP synthase [Sphingobacteriales bacterium UTBCD1]